jgi:hypothetical protein
MRDLAHGENGWNEHAAWMRRRHKAHVVVVERVSGDAVGEHCPAGTGRDLGAQHSTLAGAFVGGERLGDARRRLARAGEHHADGVDEGDRGPLARRV